MENFNQNNGENNSNKIEVLFSNALLESNKNPELKALLESIDIDTDQSIFELIKENLLKHEDSDPTSWNDGGYHYGHVGILTTDQNKTLEGQTFIIPSLNIQIIVGKIRELPSGDGMRVVWEKISDPQPSV